MRHFKQFSDLTGGQTTWLIAHKQPKHFKAGWLGQGGESSN